MKGVILTCGPFDLTAATAHTGQGIVGATPPTATVGFAHALSRDIGSRRRDLTCEACAVIVHDAALLQGHPKYPPTDAAIRKHPSGPVPGAEVIDEILLSGRVTFVLHCEPVGDPEDLRDDVEAIRPVLAGMIMARRYAGGGLHSSVRPSALTSSALSAEQVGAHLRTLPPGFVLQDRRDHLEGELAKGERDALDIVLESVAFRPVAGGGTARVLRGALCPISVGYRALERPRWRHTNRTASADIPHVYADTLASIGQWSHSRTLSRREDPLRGCLWRPYVDEALGLYYASASGPATPESRLSRRMIT